MRNLSKVLALVLSLAFVLTMFAGAIATVPETTSYSDASELSPAGSEAVSVLSALGIVNGYTDGSFQPASLVTRAEFAKMMSVALASTDVSNFYSVSTLPFNDTFDSWCIPYINYCYLNELMVGYGDGYMLPKNNVTGFEAVKMVLVGLGYDPKVEGLEGSAWQNNTAKLASRIGLMKNLETENIYGAFDREATAILVRNAIYTDTVEYVGSSAVSTGKTLGEKVYDLMDIRGIVVGNEYGYLGANWTNAAITDQTTSIKPVYFIEYKNQVVKGQTIFAYRDFTGAATTGGYYVPRIVHVAISSDYADLGRAYRILTTGAQNPTNTNEVRKIYGVIGEIATGDALDYVYKKGVLSDGGLTGAVDKDDAANLTGKIGAMLDSAQNANVTVTKDSVQYNIFIDGKAASYADAVAHIAKYSESSAPYYYVDNDNDGIVDYVSLWTYTVAKVLAVAEDGKLTLSGVGSAKTYITSAESIAVGDYVAYYGDNQYNYVDKLETYTGTVTGYSQNSGTSATTVAGGTYTINGKNYTFGSLVGTLNDATQAYFENLMGAGTAALYGTTLQFVFDGSYIVAAFTTGESYWENYAIVRNSATGDRMLGMPSVVLYTDDNELKEFYVATVDGAQIYNSITGTITLPANGALVRYEEIGNQQIALYTASYVNVNSLYSNQIRLGYNLQTGNWQDDNSNPYSWNNGVVFVTVGQTVHAYWYGEFQPTSAADFPVTSNTAAELVYSAALNGVPTIKAASLTFNANYLPGLVLRSDMKWGTVMGVTSVKNIIDTEDARAKYAYEVQILKPWGTATETVTVYANSALNTFVKGNLYKLFMSEDGVCRRWEQAVSIDADGIQSGSDYIELGGYLLTSVVSDGADGYNLYLKRPTITDTGITVNNYILHMASGVDAYFVKDLFTTGIKSYNYLEYTTSLGLTSLRAGIRVYADVNPSTNEITSVWFDDTDAPWTITVRNLNVTLQTYGPAAKTATYAAAGLTKTYTNVMPTDLKMPLGATVTDAPVTFVYDGVNGWTIDSIGNTATYSWAPAYTRTNAQAIEWDKGNKKVDIYNLSYLNATYKYDENLQGFWVRKGTFDGRVDPSIGNISGSAFYKPVSGEVENALVAANNRASGYLSYNPDGGINAYDYEELNIMVQGTKAVMVVFTDLNGDVQTDTCLDGVTSFPYNDQLSSYNG